MDEIVLRDLLNSDPQDEGAAEALARILADGQRWEDLVQLLLDRIEQTPNGNASLYRRLAEILDEKLKQPAEALVVLLDGLRRPSDDEILGEYIGILAEKIDGWDDVLNTYEALIEKGGNLAPIHRRIADWYSMVGSQDESIEHRRALYSMDPTDTANIGELQRYYEGICAWPELAQTLEEQLSHSVDSREQVELYVRLADVYESKLSEPVTALDWLGRAFLKAPNIKVMERLRDLASACEHWQALAAFFSDALKQPDNDPELTLSLHEQLAYIYGRVLGDPSLAVPHMQEIASRQPWDKVEAERLRQQLFDLSEWSALAQRLEIDITHIDDKDERGALLVELGNVYFNELQQPQDALDVWYRALKYSPDDKSILVRLMDGYRTTQQWPDSIKVLKKLTALETDVERRAQYFHAIGVIQRDKLDDVTAAVRAFDQALEFNPGFFRAFQAIEEVLVSEANYERMDRYYRKMLIRALDHELSADIIGELAQKIGELNEKHLGDYDEALKAYQLALNHCPDLRHLHAKLAEVEAKAGRFEDAVNRLMDQIDNEPRDSTPYHALVTLYCGQGRLDEAFCLCQALRVLGKSTSEEDELYESALRQRGPRQAGSLDRDTWALFTEGLESPTVGQILAFLTPMLLQSVARTERALGVTARAESGNSPIVKVIKQAAGVLNVPAPDVRPTKKGVSLRIGHLTPPVLLFGKDFEKQSLPSQRFAAARNLFLIGSRNYLATLDDNYAQRVKWLCQLMGTVHQWVAPKASIDNHLPELLTALKTLPADERAKYSALIKPLIEQPDYGVGEWLSGVESIACRLAFVFCDELETAVHEIRRHDHPLSNDPANTRILDVVLFAISPMYTSIRRRMGLSVDAD